MVIKVFYGKQYVGTFSNINQINKTIKGECYCYVVSSFPNETIPFWAILDGWEYYAIPTEEVPKDIQLLALVV